MAREAGEHVQWTCESDERAELKRGAGELFPPAHFVLWQQAQYPIAIARTEAPVTARTCAERTPDAATGAATSAMMVLVLAFAVVAV